MKAVTRHVQEHFSLATGRLILIGDVHGCGRELELMLREVSFAKEKDLVVSVGDLVRKGCHDALVMRLVMENNVRAVRGNHEERLLHSWKKRLIGELGTEKAGDLMDHEILASLDAEHLEFLEGLPHSISFPELKLLVVHAGIVPNKPLEEHTVFEITEMRGITPEGEVVKECEDKDVWAKHYHGEHLGYEVVFGHDASRGLQFEEYATGLDTGCVYGNHLTALVISKEGRKFHTVRALEQYCVPNKKRKEEKKKKEKEEKKKM